MGTMEISEVLTEKQRLWKPGKTREAEARRLIAAGFDGLYYPGECACLADDLYPRGERLEGCTPGYKADCTDNCGHEGAGPGNWHISAERESK